MTHYVIGAEGCDDSTYALIQLTDEQADAVRLVVEAINPRSTYGCKPALYFEDALKADPYKLECAVEDVNA